MEYKKEKREYRQASCDEKKEEDNQWWQKRAEETKWGSKVEQGKEREKKD